MLGEGAEAGVTKLQFAVGSDPWLMEVKNGLVVFLEVKDNRKINIPHGSQECHF